MASIFRRSKKKNAVYTIQYRDQREHTPPQTEPHRESSQGTRSVTERHPGNPKRGEDIDLRCGLGRRSIPSGRPGADVPRVG